MWYHVSKSGDLRREITDVQAGCAGLAIFGPTHRRILGQSLPPSLLRRKTEGGPSGRSFFLDAQPLRRWVGLRLPSPMAGPPFLSVLAFGSTLVAPRRVSGQFVEVGDGAGQRAEHAWVVERDVSRLRIGLGPKIDHDPLPAVQTFQPLEAPAEGFQLPREAGLEVGRDQGGDRLRTWVVGVVSPPLPAEPPGDLAGPIRAEELVDPALLLMRADAGTGRR